MMHILYRNLGRSMPARKALRPVEAWSFFTYFNTSFATTDVWTKDGWLITAICSYDEDGINVLARRGKEQETFYLIHNETLFFVPTAQTRLCRF